MSENNTNAASQLQELVYNTIALASAMQLQVKQLDEQQLVMEAPVGSANFNIHGTAFAGSIYCLCALTAWGQVHMRLLKEKQNAEVVIAKADIAYKLPVNETIRTYCHLDENDFQAFYTQLMEKGKARIDIHVEVREKEKIQATMNANIAVKLH